jgi:hypothetical protein
MKLKFMGLSRRGVYKETLNEREEGSGAAHVNAHGGGEQKRNTAVPINEGAASRLPSAFSSRLT